MVVVVVKSWCAVEGKRGLGWVVKDAWRGLCPHRGVDETLYAGLRVVQGLEHAEAVMVEAGLG